MQVQFGSVQFSRSVVSDSLWPHKPQPARPPCLSPTPGVHPNPCPLSWWCHPTISSSVVPFSSCPQSFTAAGSFPMSQLFASGGQSIGISALASVLPMNTQGWSPLGWTGWISLQSKILCRYAHYPSWELAHHPKLNSLPLNISSPFSPPFSSWQPPLYCLSLWIWWLLVPRGASLVAQLGSRVMQQLFFCVWFISLTTVSSGSSMLQCALAFLSGVNNILSLCLSLYILYTHIHRYTKTCTHLYTHP